MRSLLAAGALTLAALAAPQAAHAVPSDTSATCPARAICLWTGVNYSGAQYNWTGGYKDLPAAWRDHSYSFIANRSGGFIDWSGGQKVCRTVAKGNYGAHYDTGFGKKIDGVDNAC
ncbi:peptidase inhibitor family I36 protein [uncultured Streptomyces sp.]|uniref:peptidase inhibitor family I36 protein n=1 Tax=uncultured Streptomyces sp. TaxID=174707 RepID=UPI0026261501|nr:peptidase inhibitor family I36 protein [uncultured Streptomyces sp.]